MCCYIKEGSCLVYNCFPHHTTFSLFLFSHAMSRSLHVAKQLPRIPWLISHSIRTTPCRPRLCNSPSPFPKTTLRLVSQDHTPRSAVDSRLKAGSAIVKPASTHRLLDIKRGGMLIVYCYRHLTSSLLPTVVRLPVASSKQLVV